MTDYELLEQRLDSVINAFQKLTKELNEKAEKGTTATEGFLLRLTEENEKAGIAFYYRERLPNVPEENLRWVQLGLENQRKLAAERKKQHIVDFLDDLLRVLWVYIDEEIV